MCNEMPRKNTTAEMIEVIKAHEAGKKLEYRYVFEEFTSNNPWEPARPSFNFNENQYRVKEEPKFFFTISSDGKLWRSMPDRTQQEADDFLKRDQLTWPMKLFTMKKYAEVK